MSQAHLETVRINLRGSDDARDVVHRTVAALAQGEAVFLKSERFHGSIRGLWTESTTKRFDDQRKGTLLLRGLSDLEDWVGPLNSSSSRLVRKCWPSNLSLVFALKNDLNLFQRLSSTIQSLMLRPEGLEVLVPDQLFLREVLRLVPGPIGFFPVADDRFTPKESLVIEDFDAPFRSKPSTAAKIQDDCLVMIREGTISADVLRGLSATTILFVCTGNTCRSPMAEALCKILLAKRLGCEIDELESKGFVVLSAGVAAPSGMPAAAHAVELVEARGGSLQAHSSRMVSKSLLLLADHVLAMTAEHLEILLDRIPEVAERSRPLHPEGDDVPDPVGMSFEVYEETADAIEAYLNVWLDSIGL